MNNFSLAKKEAAKKYVNMRFKHTNKTINYYASTYSGKLIYLLAIYMGREIYFLFNRNLEEILFQNTSSEGIAI